MKIKEMSCKFIDDTSKLFLQFQTYGLLLETVARLQLNMMVQPDPDIR